MAILRGILDRIVLVLAILALFQDIANRFHGGDIQKLIKHHLASTDPTFRAEGTAIQVLLDNVAHLKATLAALNADFYTQLAYLAKNGDATIARATWDAFVPALSLTAETLLFAFATGVAIWLVFLAGWIAMERFMDVVLARGRPGKWSPPKKPRASTTK